MFTLCGAEGTDVDHTSQRGGHAQFHAVHDKGDL